MLFWKVDFDFAHFAHFEIEETFGLIWIKLQNGQFHLQISISGKFSYT